jgi:hypothetical protein
MNTARRSGTAVLAATTLALMVSGCSSSKASTANVGDSAPQGATSSGGAGGPSSEPASTGSTSQMLMRVVNLYTPEKKAGPALDVYDVQLTGQKATPIATNVAYGGVSSYFKPHSEPNSMTVQLNVLPAGEDPVTKKADAQGLGGTTDDGSHPQITWVLTADSGSVAGNGPLARVSFSSLVEKGTDSGAKAPVAPPAPSGKGEFLADTHAVLDPGAALFLKIDDLCDEPLNGDPSKPGIPYIASVDGQAPVSNFAIFAAPVGTHQVSVVESDATVHPACAQLTAAQGGTSVDVSAGQQIETFVYGTSDTDLHLALAPIRS